MSDIKLIALYGSPRRGGNTELLLNEFIKGAESAGAVTDRLHVLDHSIEPCRGCLGCFRNGCCVIADDMQAIYDRLLAADIVVLASPIYFYGVTGWAKSLIDRIQALWARKYELKDPSLGEKGKKRKGFFIAVGGTKGPRMFEGAILTAKYFFDAFNTAYRGELLVRGVDAKDDILKQPELLKEAFRKGKQMVEEAKPE